jgi:hypothetical protein
MFAANSVFNHEVFAERFSRLGYPSDIIYPLVAANVLGLIGIWTRLSRALTEWAYAGFLFNFVLAFLAEIRAEDGEIISSSLALLCLIVSYYSRSNPLLAREAQSGPKITEVPVEK